MTGSWGRSVSCLTVTYCVVFAVIDLYIIDSLFIKYTVGLKEPVIFNVMYIFTLALVWLFKTFAYVLFCITTANRFFHGFYITDISKLIRGIAIPLSVFLLIFYTALYVIALFWFNAPYSSLVNIFFYVSMYGILLRQILAKKCPDDLNYIFIYIIILNILPILLLTLATSLLLIGISNVALEQVYMSLLGRQRNLISFYYDAMNILMFIFSLHKCRAS